LSDLLKKQQNQWLGLKFWGTVILTMGLVFQFWPVFPLILLIGMLGFCFAANGWRI
jgi:hypothetical protein